MQPGHGLPPWRMLAIGSLLHLVFEGVGARRTLPTAAIGGQAARRPGNNITSPAARGYPSPQLPEKGNPRSGRGRAGACAA